MGTKNTIAITGYSKPELLFLNLENIYSDASVSNYKVLIFTEIGFNNEEYKVFEYYRNNFNTEIEFIVRPKHPRCPMIGFHNILQSYLDAADQTSEYIIVTEEDIVFSKDILRFADYSYREFLSKYDRIFCVAHKRRAETEIVGRPDILIGDYQLTSPCVISKRIIDNYLRPFFTKDFFDNPLYYYRDCRIRPWEHQHQDGALERVMLYNNLFALKPDQARSGHCGLGGGIFSRGISPSGDWEERIAQWRLLLRDGQKLRSLSGNPDDLCVTNFEGYKWSELLLDVNRDLAIASKWWYDNNNEFKKYIEDVK